MFTAEDGKESKPLNFNKLIHEFPDAKDTAVNVNKWNVNGLEA